MTDELLNQIEQLANAVVIRTADAEVAVVPVLVAEVKRLRAILVALREPSDAVVDAAREEFFVDAIVETADWYHMRRAIRAAVAAAEQEDGV